VAPFVRGTANRETVSHRVRHVAYAGGCTTLGRRAGELLMCHSKRTMIACATSLLVGATPVALHAQSARPRQPSETVKMTVGATARCGDGAWSTSAARDRACIGHGGVAHWFGPMPKQATARCKDGEFWTRDDLNGACRGHGGIGLRIRPAQPRRVSRR
jgi:hypothetical protein